MYYWQMLKVRVKRVNFATFPTDMQETSFSQKKLAVEADNTALNELKNREESQAHHKQEEINAAKATAEALDGKTVTVKAKAGSNGKLFGSVTSKEIAAEIEKSLNIKIDRKKMQVADIKNFGEYTAEIKLYKGITAKVNVVVPGL